MKVAIVCMGNIFRSQVFEHYLRSKIKKETIEIFSCGILKKEDLPEEEILLKEVKDELLKRGLNVNPIRTPWTNNIKEKLKDTNIILAATSEIKKFLIKETKNENVKTFYEFVGEEEKDFVDTFDYKKRKQDTKKFMKGFNEIERLAKLTANKLK